MKQDEALKALCRQVYSEIGFSEPASETLAQRIMAEPALVRAAVLQCAYDQLRAIMHDTRGILVRRPAPDMAPKVYSEETRRRVTEKFHGLFAWPLMDGSMLAEATHDKLELEAERYQRNADGNQIRARWFRLLAAKVQGEQRVRDVFRGDGQVRKLLQRAENETLAGAG
jgi:hypothetical protein